MNNFVALLRAVNVGGTGKLPMAELRSMCESIGLEKVRTYIQSGNVVFSSDLERADIKEKLEEQLFAYASKDVGVILRNEQELRDVLSLNPFQKSEGNKVVVIFLDAAPPENVIKTAQRLSNEEIFVGDREVFVHYPSGIGLSRVSLNVMAKGTARNINTVTKLAQML